MLPLIEPSPRQSDKKCCCQLSRDLSQSPAACALALMAIMASAEAGYPEKDLQFEILVSSPLLMRFCLFMILINPCCFSDFSPVQDNDSPFGKEQNNIAVQLTFSGQRTSGAPKQRLLYGCLSIFERKGTACIVLLMSLKTFHSLQNAQ